MPLIVQSELDRLRFEIREPLCLEAGEFEDAIVGIGHTFTIELIEKRLPKTVLGLLIGTNDHISLDLDALKISALFIEVYTRLGVGAVMLYLARRGVGRKVYIIPVYQYRLDQRAGGRISVFPHRCDQRGLLPCDKLIDAFSCHDLIYLLSSETCPLHEVFF